MLAGLFHGIGQGQELVGVARDHVGDPGLAGGDGAGFVQDDDLRLARLFQGNGGLEEDAVLGAHAVAHHDGHGGRQAQGAGAGNH